jgi:hypothetical protein
LVQFKLAVLFQFLLHFQEGSPLKKRAASRKNKGKPVSLRRLAPQYSHHNYPLVAFLIRRLYVENRVRPEKWTMRLNDRAVRIPAAERRPHRFPFRFIKSISLSLISVVTGLNFPG